MPETYPWKDSIRWDDLRRDRDDRSGVTLLAVDDDDAVRYSIVGSLREAGYNVVEARSGQEALARLSERPDLVLLSVNLPDIHGFQICKKIKSDPATCHIPVLHLSSSFIDPEARVQGLESGADAYLAEPIDRGELVATVGALLRIKQAEAMARQQAEIAERALNEVAQLNQTLERRVNERTAELNKANESLRELSGRLLRLQDEERKRIARELHDGVGQLLAAITMNQGTITKESEKLSPKGIQAFNENRDMIAEILQSIRTISYLLHPPLLEVSGLSSALQSYADEFSRRSGIAVEMDCPQDIPRLQTDLETTVFRIVQECLGNAHRHSGSSSVMIWVKIDGREITVEVNDHGRGIPVEKQQELKSGGIGGVGLRGMRERIAQFGGHLQIESTDQGTTIRATLPYIPAASSEL